MYASPACFYVNEPPVSVITDLSVISTCELLGADNEVLSPSAVVSRVSSSLISLVVVLMAFVLLVMLPELTLSPAST